ncbi:MAG: cupin domain-containing protein [Pararhodobacter sp.]|nr:cupin domain-containing protein [Pararhodobacter sp.]
MKVSAMIRHHISDSLLMAYSAGQLPEAFNLVVASHVSMCDECRARLESFDAVGGALLEASLEHAHDQSPAAAAPMAADSLAATMQRIRAAGPARREPAPRSVRRGLFPTPLASYVGGDLGAVKWKPVGGGVRQAILPTDSTASARLLYIPAGVGVPDHGHRGTELTLVLQGAFSDAYDRFGPGDLEIATADDEHSPVAEAGADCICLAATDAPLKFNTFLPRVLQPFLRI